MRAHFSLRSYYNRRFIYRFSITTIKRIYSATKCIFICAILILELNFDNEFAWNLRRVSSPSQASDIISNVRTECADGESTQ